MLLRDLINLLDAKALFPSIDLDKAVDNAGASDLMSDVLALTKPGSVLLTGLCSVQVIRTAEMLDLKAIVFVRDKMPDSNAMALAMEMGLPLFTSPYPLYEACGILYKEGLPGALGASPPIEHWAKVRNQRAQCQVALNCKKGK